MTTMFAAVDLACFLRTYCRLLCVLIILPAIVAVMGKSSHLYGGFKDLEFFL